jgi:hypothetical protein
MIDNQIREQILEPLIEDYYGLWELTGVAGEPSVDELIPVVDQLIRDGLAEIYVGSKFASEESKLNEDEARRAIRDRTYWDWSAPAKGDHLRAAATPSGADWYRGRRAQ